ncbi:mRNA splicing protein [Exophiala dermatitidis]|uniref:Pre-mRNA-processing protein 45 n=2 Tax=Exophiala dermatitidis TaxID=5970 RepID=H6BW91_EXODN|nr:pre-mRNA-processing protein 45 [Exophiala dermatitidis NIH/UT8656]KAJ4502458.1 mRNA splicing protein [Exophiala dermatitidis]EHY55190.1 pre-mRNA-processing protein 45 [Exophiala dermatitidis NIH/UT8656]KAJ4503784.1 mRNA splicing protein [Exophiala dermatitidis]KAJ4508175.1 mRNA splicing protein [Exophiala dermatitidis]KAJ4531901.1 mRNA splicing protein [Exophiala dermatitidis]
MSTGLFASLPKPKYTGEHEEVPTHAQPKGPRIVGPGVIDESQIVLKRSGPPPYGQRSGWRPRSVEDFGDGGAFPEIPVAQYPLDMGRKGTSSTSNALAIQVDAEGKVKYDAIARQGHSESRIIHSSFKDLIPLRQRADAGDLSLERPSQEEVQATAEKTKQALEKLVSGAVAAQKPKNVKGASREEPTYVRYTPANQMGDNSKKNDRIFKIVKRQEDPMEPPKFKHKKIPRGPPSPPPPVMHSPPRKLTAEDQEAWKIPPPISNWKNPKGYTVPLDKRLAADGRGMQDVTINDKFAQFAEALFTADRHAREEVKLRAQMQQKLAEKEKLAKEEHLREMARKAREERQQKARRRDSTTSRGRSRSVASSRSRTPSDTEDDEAARERERARRERRLENERQLRQSRMGAEKKIQMMAREQNRDISEKVALGLAKPTQNKETMYDSRLFNQTSGFDTGFNEDQHYDKPLFAAHDAINSIYRPSAANQDDDDGDDAADAAMGKIEKSNRFEVLGKASQGFKGADLAEREAGPVQFEKDKDDPFGIDSLIGEASARNGGEGDAAGKKRYGLEEAESSDRGKKRARVDEDD